MDADGTKPQKLAQKGRGLGPAVGRSVVNMMMYICKCLTAVPLANGE